MIALQRGQNAIETSYFDIS